MKELDFTQRNVETLSLDDLRRTFKENYPNGLPVGGIYHFDLIQGLIDIIQSHNIKTVVQDIFAANNREKYRPGVSVSDVVAAEKGANSLEAHILRRVYANINLELDVETDVKLNCAVAYHQKGIQIAFGPYWRWLTASRCTCTFSRSTRSWRRRPWPARAGSGSTSRSSS